MTFRLTRKAEGDVIEIYRHGARTFGLAQADAYHEKLEAAFRLLTDQPYIARARAEIDPPVRVYPVGSHIIIYTVSPDDSVLIVRIRHGREDWINDPYGSPVDE